MRLYVFQVLLSRERVFGRCSSLSHLPPVCPASPAPFSTPSSGHVLFRSAVRGFLSPPKQVPERPPDSRSPSHNGSAFRHPPMYVPVPTVIVGIGTLRCASLDLSHLAISIRERHVRVGRAATGYTELVCGGTIREMIRSFVRSRPIPPCMGVDLVWILSWGGRT